MPKDLFEFACVEPETMAASAAVQDHITRHAGRSYVAHPTPAAGAATRGAGPARGELLEPVLEVVEELRRIGGLEELTQLVGIEPGAAAVDAHVELDVVELDDDLIEVANGALHQVSILTP